MKKNLSAEAAYVSGLIFLAFGTAFMEKADYGMSMVVAPAYLFHLKVSRFFPWFSFGMAEYVFQAFLILLLSVVVRRFQKRYLFSFVTAVVYGLILDGSMKILSGIPTSGHLLRISMFVLGMIICAMGVSLLFHTYIAPEAYELFVKEVSSAFHTDIHKTKTVYDCTSCVVAICLSFLFFGFGHFEGVKVGTILCALLNGWLIGRCSKLLERGVQLCALK